MEFKLINPKEENGFIQSIEFNFDELKTELQERLEKYNNLVYTRDNLKEAKEDKAGLNKFKEAIETRRKEIKKLCLKPYNDFELKIKELTGLIDKPILAIDTQLKTFEDERIEKRTTEIENFYLEAIGDLLDILPLDRFFDKKWLNATVKILNIQKEITEIIGKVRGNLNVITDLKLESDLELQVKDKYLQTLDFVQAMAEKTRLENLKKALIEKNQKKEEIAEVIQEPAKEIEQPLEWIEEKTLTCKFWVEGTKEQLKALQKYLIENNLKYGGLK